jgi:ribonuclease P protein component
MPTSRLGLVVSRRVGPAVTRNLVKRRFREIFRSLSDDLSTAIDIVVIARKGVDEVPFPDLKQQFAHRLRISCGVSLSE